MTYFQTWTLTSRFSVNLAMSVLMLIAAAVLAAPAHAAKDPVYTGLFSNVAVSGYDPVAYFREGKPVEGSSAFETEHDGYTYRFANQTNLDDFIADPEAFAPQYGGYCAWAVSQGSTASADPNNWTIVDGKLYLNYNDDVQSRWEADIPGFIEKADSNWPKVLQ
ncbi:YHS domain-containing (seleno)protein [Pyruvatibacter sp.]|uniref:YHS domain-containing (seleno)protein n=1 Tax=Pyruvatibacter sp. TaxID=1981328 RepID=UPI003266B987